MVILVLNNEDVVEVKDFHGKRIFRAIKPIYVSLICPFCNIAFYESSLKPRKRIVVEYRTCPHCGQYIFPVVEIHYKGHVIRK